MGKAADAGFVPPVTEEAVRAKTGKGWDDWFELLDKAGAARKSHQEIVAILSSKYSKDVGEWWQQMLTVGYERARGLREKNQRSDGAFSMSASKTVGVSVDVLYDAFADAKRRAKWLSGAKPSVRSSTKGKSMRLEWDDGTSVAIGFLTKGDDKSQVSVEHAGLADAEEVARMKTFWKEQLERLKKSFGE